MRCLDVACSRCSHQSLTLTSSKLQSCSSFFMELVGIAAITHDWCLAAAAIVCLLPHNECSTDMHKCGCSCIKCMPMAAMEVGPAGAQPFNRSSLCSPQLGEGPLPGTTLHCRCCGQGSPCCCQHKGAGAVPLYNPSRLPNRHPKAHALGLSAHMQA